MNTAWTEDWRGGRTLLTARWVVGHQRGSHVLLPQGQIVIEDDRVVFVGFDFPGEVRRRIDLGNALIGPGFVDIDALGDLDTSILEFDNQPGHLKGRISSAAYRQRGQFEHYSTSELAFQKRYAFAHLLKSGVTTALPVPSLLYREWAETFAEHEDAAKSAIELGLRVYLGPAYRSGHSVVNEDNSVSVHFDDQRGRDGLAEAVRFCETHDNTGGGLIRALLAPDRIENCNPTLMAATAELGDRLNVPVRMHACQSSFEYETILKLHGCSPIEYLAQTGLLSSRLIIPHLTHVAGSRLVPRPGRDLEMVSDAGASLAHCPLLSARQGEAIESLRRYLELGIRVGIGTDTWPPNMIANGRWGMLISRVIDSDNQSMRANDMYDLMTVGGADILGRPDLGRLETGALADLTVFSFDHAHIGQVIDPIQTMFIAGRGSEFSHVVVNGRPVVVDYAVVGFDEKLAQKQAQAQFDRLLATYPSRTPGNPPLETMFPPSYPLVQRESPNP